MKIMEGKAALVTGAASGLGFATAKAFAQARAAVALADWNEKLYSRQHSNLQRKDMIHRPSGVMFPMINRSKRW